MSTQTDALVGKNVEVGSVVSDVGLIPSDFQLRDFTMDSVPDGVSASEAVLKLTLWIFVGTIQMLCEATGVDAWHPVTAADVNKYVVSHDRRLSGTDMRVVSRLQDIGAIKLEGDKLWITDIGLSLLKVIKEGKP